MKMSVRPELTTAPPARVRDMRHTDGAVDNSALLPNHPGSTYKSGNAVQTAGATSISKIVAATATAAASCGTGMSAMLVSAASVEKK